MDATWEAAFDMAVLQPPDLTSSVVSFAQQAAFSTLMVAGMLMVVVGLAALILREDSGSELHSSPGFRGSERSQPFGRALELSTGGRGRPRSQPEPVAVTAGPSASLAEQADALKGGSFSPTDVTALRALRKRVESGDIAEGATGVQRLRFARWLAQQGKIQG